MHPAWSTAQKQPKIPTPACIRASNIQESSADFAHTHRYQHPEPCSTEKRLREIFVRPCTPKINENTNNLCLIWQEEKRLVLCNFEKDISFFRRPCEVAASCSHPIKQMLAQTPSQLDAMHAQNQPHHSGKHHLHIWTKVSISWRRAITVSRNVERKGVVGNLYKEDSLRYVFVKPLPEDRFVGERVSPPGWKLKMRCRSN